MLPTTLTPTATMALQLSQGTVHIPLCRPQFAAYTRPTDINRFGGKDLLLVDDQPQFAEVAILRAFENAGWQGRWLETYGHMHAPALWCEWKTGGSGAQEHLPIQEQWVNERLQAIAKANGGSYSGCWDVVAWKDDLLLFAEAKRQKKDKMRGTQLRWLETALHPAARWRTFWWWSGRSLNAPPTNPAPPLPLRPSHRAARPSSWISTQ